jgi:hypothetical protein
VPHQQAGHKTAPDLMSKLQKILAMQEPSTQDIEACVDDVRFQVVLGIIRTEAITR